MGTRLPDFYSVLIPPMLRFDMGVQSIPLRRAGRPRVPPPAAAIPAIGVTADYAHMRALAAFTARSMRTECPRPFGAAIVHTRSGRLFLRALNAVKQQCDPSAHAELRAIRLAAKRL